MNERRTPVALVTGARRGIGRGIAFALAEAGFDVVVNDVVEDDAVGETLAGLAERGRRGAFLVHDVADVAGHAAFAERAWQAFGTVDCLVNNAGVQVAQRGDILDVTPASFDRLVAVNLRGTFFLAQACARRMVAEPRDAVDPPRSIVTVSSATARSPGVHLAEYSMTKAGLAMMSQLFALRLAQHDIMCYEVRPGIIRTDMTAPAKARYDKLIAEGGTPVARWGEPDDVGRAVAALAARMLPFCTGDAFDIDGGLHMRAL